jgi:hypothetical protein
MISWHTIIRTHDSSSASRGYDPVKKIPTIARAQLSLCPSGSNLVYKLMTSFKYCCCMAFVI